jgi:hypothetical protein
VAAGAAGEQEEGRGEHGGAACDPRSHTATVAPGPCRTLARVRAGTLAW